MRGERNIVLAEVITTLKRASRKNKAKIYNVAAEYLAKSGSGRPQVNVGRIGYNTKAGDVVLVPGKVLGAGAIPHKVIVGAYSFSKASAEKIEDAGGRALSLSEMLNEYPSGKGVVLIGG
ncbi:MAG: 50S ribosomal protein L18e [Thaumarchaeota archaeon]|nr:50S ribosomal protein L18e [Nitrososphaerota archaeon]